MQIANDDIPGLSGVEIKPVSGKAAKQLVIFLHGLGADAQDLISIGTEWQRMGLLPDAAFVSPNAPYDCDMAPMGYQWFSLQDRSKSAIMRGVRTAEPILNNYIDRELQRHNLKEKDLAVVGFSQGAMMAFYALPRRQNPCAAVVGYSGMLLDTDGLKAANIVKPNVLIIHGDADDVVPGSNLPLAYEGFKLAGFKTEKMLIPGLGHSIDQAGLERGGSFVKEAFGI